MYDLWWIKRHFGRFFFKSLGFLLLVKCLHCSIFIHISSGWWTKRPRGKQFHRNTARSHRSCTKTKKKRCNFVIVLCLKIVVGSEMLFCTVQLTLYDSDSRLIFGFRRRCQQSNIHRDFLGWMMYEFYFVFRSPVLMKMRPWQLNNQFTPYKDMHIAADLQGTVITFTHTSQHPRNSCKHGRKSHLLSPTVVTFLWMI